MKVVQKTEGLPAEVQATIETYFSTPIKIVNGQECDIRLVSVREDEAKRLARLVLDVMPERSLEIGLACAASTIAIASARRFAGLSVPHVVLDPYQNTLSGGVGLQEVEKAGLSNHIEWKEIASEHFLPAAVSRGEKVGLVFDDGSKQIGHTITNAFWIDRILPVGGIVAFHDGLLYSHAVAARYLVQERGYEIIDLSGGISWRRVARQVRYAHKLGVNYSLGAIPSMFRSMIAFRKTTEG
jgi:Methyltransferase domain